jgi:hypothetical protein
VLLLLLQFDTFWCGVGKTAGCGAGVIVSVQRKEYTGQRKEQSDKGQHKKMDVK